MCSCREDVVHTTLVSSKWQHFTQYGIDNQNAINITYIVFDESNNIKSFFVNSKNSYPYSSGLKWKYRKSDSTFYFGDIKFKILKIEKDTIYMLSDKNERNYLVKYKPSISHK